MKLNPRQKHGPNLKITSLSLETFKVEEYMREFEQLQMRVVLDEESKLKIARFIKRLSPNITNEVDRQSDLSFDDVCNLVIKVKR